jgi:CIC family chloride channel protein
VFGGAARVPIATLLMVAEMTGGYQLLVPAGLAVMLSYILQINLSRVLKYDSLYEAQVAGRSDSPAHRAEQVQTALRLLDSGNLPLPADTTHLHLASLLQTGLALELPDGSELIVGLLPPESPWVGKEIQSRPASDVLAHTRIASILRGTTVVLARPNTILQPGDRVLIVVQPEALGKLGEYLSPVTSVSIPAA